MRLLPVPLTTAAPLVEAVLQRLFNRQVGEVICGWENENYCEYIFDSIFCIVKAQD